MTVASEADEAWCPPTFKPSMLSRTWLAWWMVQLASQSTFFSSSPRMRSSSGAMRAIRRLFVGSEPDRPVGGKGFT